MPGPQTIAVAALLLLLPAARAGAHDAEHTQVSLAFAPDGWFVLDVSNDPNWLKLRMEPFRGNFADRVVLWVDGREVRPSSVEFVPGDTLATYRLRGRMPLDARSLRWYYGLVIDPYPLTIRRADGRVVVEEVGGDAWSRTIDLSGQFSAPLISDRSVVLLLLALLFAPVIFRLRPAVTSARFSLAARPTVYFRPRRTRR